MADTSMAPPPVDWFASRPTLETLPVDGQNDQSLPLGTANADQWPSIDTGSSAQGDGDTFGVVGTSPTIMSGSVPLDWKPITPSLRVTPIDTDSPVGSMGGGTSFASGGAGSSGGTSSGSLGNGEAPATTNALALALLVVAAFVLLG